MQRPLTPEEVNDLLGHSHNARDADPFPEHITFECQECRGVVDTRRAFKRLDERGVRRWTGVPCESRGVTYIIEAERA